MVNPGPDDPNDDDYLPPMPERRRRWARAVRVAVVLMLLGGLTWVAVAMLAPPAPVRSVGGRGAELPAALVGGTAAEVPPPPAPAPSAPVRAPTPPLARQGFLTVNATPWAELSVDGRLVGTTPIAELPVPAGRHTLRFVHEGFEPEVRVVIVSPGQTLRVTGITLRPVGP